MPIQNRSSAEITMEVVKPQDDPPELGRVRHVIIGGSPQRKRTRRSFVGYVAGAFAIAAVVALANHQVRTETFPSTFLCVFARISAEMSM